MMCAIFKHHFETAIKSITKVFSVFSFFEKMLYIASEFNMSCFLDNHLGRVLGTLSYILKKILVQNPLSNPND